MFVKRNKTPAENFEILVKVLRFVASICGIDLLRPDYRMNWITYLIFLAIISYYVCIILTILKHYKEDWTIILRASVTIGTGLQGVFKLFTGLVNRKVILNLYKMLSSIYHDYEKKGEKYWKALDISVVKTEQGLIYLMFMFLFGYIGTISVTYTSLILGSRNLILEFEIPGLDIKTDLGYFLTLGFQTFLAIAFGFGLYCGDLVALIYLLQSFMFSYVFEAKIEYFNELIVNPENCKTQNVSKRLKDIVEWYQIYSDYISRCNNLFYYIITVEVLTSFGSTILSTYLILAGGWIGAYTYCTVAFCSLYLYCILGTENEKANDKFVDDVQNIHWYNLSVSDQKVVLQLIAITQSPQIIDVAGVMPLSVSTALKLTKTVYSITMFMIEFLVD